MYIKAKKGSSAGVTYSTINGSSGESITDGRKITYNISSLNLTGKILGTDFIIVPEMIATSPSKRHTSDISCYMNVSTNSDNTRAYVEYTSDASTYITLASGSSSNKIRVYVFG